MATDLLRRGETFLSEKRHAHMAREIVYRTASGDLSILATPGLSAIEAIDEQTGGMIPSHARDYIVRASDLTKNGVAFEPVAGHIIIDGAMVFEVANLGTEQCWRWSDPSGYDMRIHTKQAASSLQAASVA